MRCLSGDNHYLLGIAQGDDELQAVFRFRYEHFFHCFPDGFPGLDRILGRVFEPHDLASVHFCALDADGKLCAVSTATPPDARDAPSEWGRWFQLGRLYNAGLNRIIVSTRMVIHPDHRRHGLFEIFYRFIIERYVEEGFECTLHYCSPGLIWRYEKLGHRLFGEPFTMPPGLLRTPMLMAFGDPDHLRRVASPIARMCQSRALGLPSSAREALSKLLMLPEFRLISPDERLFYLRSRIGTRLLEPGRIVPVLERASPLFLRAGLHHTPPPDDGFLCFVLSGAVREDRAHTRCGPGSFVGAGLLLDPEKFAPQLEVVDDSEVLVFDRDLVRAASRIEDNGRSPWRLLYLACCELPSEFDVRG